jgi:hypothetical protein
MPRNRYKVTDKRTNAYAYAKDGAELDQIIVEMIYYGALVEEIKLVHDLIGQDVDPHSYLRDWTKRWCRGRRSKDSVCRPCVAGSQIGSITNFRTSTQCYGMKNFPMVWAALWLQPICQASGHKAAKSSQLARGNYEYRAALLVCG